MTSRQLDITYMHVIKEWHHIFTQMHMSQRWVRPAPLPAAIVHSGGVSLEEGWDSSDLEEGDSELSDLLKGRKQVVRKLPAGIEIISNGSNLT